MLKVNIGLSRKLTRDYNSTGFSVNLEGEVAVGLDDPEHLIEKIHEYFDLADETLTQQIERYESVSAIASRDEVRPQPSLPSVPDSPSQSSKRGSRSNGKSVTGKSSSVEPVESESPLPPSDPATNKQIQFLLNLGKRSGWNTHQVEAHIEQVYGRKIGVYQLSKKQAGEMIERLNGAELTPPNPSRLGRHTTASV